MGTDKKRDRKGVANETEARSNSTGLETAAVGGTVVAPPTDGDDTSVVLEDTITAADVADIVQGAATDGLLREAVTVTQVTEDNAAATLEAVTEAGPTETSTAPEDHPAEAASAEGTDPATGEPWRGKYTASEEKLKGQLPQDFKYLNTPLFPGHAPKGFLRSLEPAKEGAKARKDSVFTVIYRITLKHWEQHQTGITGGQLVLAMLDYDWSGTNSPYCAGGKPCAMWAKDYVIGAARPKQETIMLTAPTQPFKHLHDGSPVSAPTETSAETAA